MTPGELATNNMDLARRVNYRFFKGNCDHPEFEEGQGEARLELWRAAVEYCEKDSKTAPFRNYAALRIRRRLIDQLQRRQRRRQADEVEYLAYLDYRKCPESSADFMAMRNIPRVLAKLPERHREILIETYWVGGTKEDVSRRLGYASVKRYWENVERAQRRVKNLLEDRGVINHVCV